MQRLRDMGDPNMNQAHPRFPAGEGEEQPGLDPLSGEVTVYKPPELDESNDNFPRGAHRSFEKETNREKVRWFNEEADATYLRENAQETSAGSLRIRAGRTTYVEFRLEAPTGMALEATCNGCWETWYVGPFREAVECPFCRSGRHRAGIHTTQVMGGE